MFAGIRFQNCQSTVAVRIVQVGCVPEFVTRIGRRMINKTGLLRRYYAILFDTLTHRQADQTETFSSCLFGASSLRNSIPELKLVKPKFASLPKVQQEAPSHQTETES